MPHAEWSSSSGLQGTYVNVAWGMVSPTLMDIVLVVYVRGVLMGDGGRMAADGGLRARPCPPLYPRAASWVIDACAVLGIPRETVTWRGDAVVSNRAARV